MRRIVLGCTVLLLGAVGCGSSNSPSSTCDNVANALSSLTGKVSACGQLSVPFDKNVCVSALNSSSCSDADRQKINDFANCVNGLPNCSPQSQSSWESAYLGCGDKLQGISQTCASGA